MSKPASIPYQIYPEHNLFVVKLRGIVSFQSLFGHVQELMNDPQYRNGYNGLYDFSDVQKMEGELSVFADLAEDMSDEDIITEPAKTAIIVQKGQVSVRSMLEGYVMMTSASSIDYRIFNEDQLPQAGLHIDLADGISVNEFGVCKAD